MQEFKEVPVEFNQIKVGDWVRLDGWSDFYEVGFVMPDVIKVEYCGNLASYGSHVKGQWYKKEEVMKDNTNSVDAPQNETTQEPLFKVGDVVWDVVYGKGEVVNYSAGDFLYPVHVVFKDNTNASTASFTQDGRITKNANRTLFFSEPKIEALTERPFQSKLIGKSVVVVLEGGYKYFEKVYAEDADRIYTTPDGVYSSYWSKEDLDAVYEISSENLLVKG